MMISGMKFSWGQEPAVSQYLDWPCLMSVNDLDDAAEYAYSKCVDDTKTGSGSSYTTGTVLPSRGTLTGKKWADSEPHEVQHSKMQTSAFGEKQPQVSVYIGQESTSWEMTL